MNKKEIDIDNEIEKRWDDFYERSSKYGTQRIKRYTCM